MKKFQKFLFSFFLAFSLFAMTAPVVMAEDSEVVEEANYTITYVLSGGVNSTSNPGTYDGMSTITLKNPTRTGYTFGGWYSDSKYKKKVTSIKAGSTGNKTFYAKWTANSYTIKYNANGGTGKMSDTTTKYSTNVTLTNKFKRTGYTFTGWNTKKDGSGTSYKNKEVVKGLVSKNKGTITLYAQWKKNTYKITYNLNGGTNSSSNPTTYTVTTSTITLKSPTRTGYTFGGWYSDSKYKKKVTSIKKGSTGSKTLYAKWTVNTYTVKYNSNGGTGKMSNTSVKYNKSVTLTSNKFKRTGYTFTGWNTKKDGSGTSYKNKASIKNLTSKNKGTITLYAQWKKNTYTIKYNLNGGKEVSNPTSYTVTTKTITLKNPTRTGYTFGGWYSDSKYKKEVTTIKKGSTGNKTFYAKWTANSYTIKYNANGGTGKMSNTSAKYNKSVTLTSNKFKRTGYTFTGWNTKKDGTGTTYTNKESVKNLTSKNKETVTLYAEWKKNTYTIKYNLNGGENSTSNPETYTVTTGTITLKNPTRTGYTFGGWYSDSKYKTKVTSIKKGSTGNKTLYAKWSVNSYTIKYNGNGATNGKMSDVVIKYDKTITLTNKFQRIGYKFIGWNTEADGTGTSYTDEKVVKGLTTANKGTVTLYAQWEKETYNITYDLNGGDLEGERKNSFSYEEYIHIADPMKKGYRFQGWKISASSGTMRYFSLKDSCLHYTEDITITAIWEPNKYYINYEMGHGYSISNSVQVAYDETVSLEDPRFIIMGYAFTGWNTKEDGSGTSYASHEKVQNLTSQDEDTITLYAQWEKETYTITYDLNGGVEGGKNPTTYDIDSETIFLADPIRDGYTFIGWLLVDENTYISSINTNWHHRNLKLQAQWEDTLIVDSPNSIVVKKQIDIPITLGTLLGSSDVSCSSSDSTIVSCYIKEVYEGYEYKPAALHITALLPGKATVTIKNATESVDIEVTVPNFWQDVELIIPETIGKLGDEKNRIQITNYNFYARNSQEYEMTVDALALKIDPSQRIYWNDYVMFFDENDDIIMNSIYLSSSEKLRLGFLEEGKTYQATIKVPRETARIVFLANPETVDGDESTKLEWTYFDAINLNAYLNMAMFELNQAYLDITNGWVSSLYDFDGRIFENVQISDWSLKNAIELLKKYSSITTEDGEDLLEVVQNLEEIYKDIDTYQIDESNWVDYKILFEQQIKEGNEKIKKPLEVSKNLVKNLRN